MLALGRKYPDRVWAMEGCYGIGRHMRRGVQADGRGEPCSALGTTVTSTLIMAAPPVVYSAR